MYHADLLGGLAAWIARRDIGIAWNVRASRLDAASVRRRTIWMVRACTWMSRWLPDRVVCCGEVVRRVHRDLGYPEAKLEVIPNGIQTELFRPDPVTRASVRRELDVGEHDVLIGMAARFDPMKDHRTFIEAAGLLIAERPQARFVLCGENVEPGNGIITNWARNAMVEGRCHLLGRRDDMPRITASLDVASLSSAVNEGWPNVIGEAMACGVPCAVTDVGESRQIVGETGRVVPIRDPSALAAAWRDLIDLGSSGREALGRAARRRIEQHYGLAMTVRRYQTLYEDLVRTRVHGR
jgi:glycosyltransferase involved in cell wall biosynthesis